MLKWIPEDGPNGHFHYECPGNWITSLHLALIRVCPQSKLRCFAHLQLLYIHTSYTRLVEYSILHQNCASTCSMCACDVNKCSLLLCIHSNRLGSTCMLLSLSTTETFERCKHCILPYILGLWSTHAPHNVVQLNPMWICLNKHTLV